MNILSQAIKEIKFSKLMVTKSEMLRASVPAYSLPITDHHCWKEVIQ